jgi:hyperosmotically inducible periplasmic protein
MGEQNQMKKLALSLALIATLALGVACNNKKDQQTSSTENTATGQTSQAANTNVSKVDDDSINNALTAANLGSVKVHVDNDKSVVNLSGEVDNADQKAQAEQIAKQNSGGYVVANEIAVRPMNASNDTKKVDSKTDDAIKSSFQALVAKNNWDNQHINPDVNNGVLTLKGDVDTQSQRTTIEKAASKIPHVKQVVNELTVKDAGK